MFSTALVCWWPTPGVSVKAQNLVENALRHGKGTVTLRALDVPGGVVLEVSDEGRTQVEFAPLAFERFTRADRTRDGVGLGLAIVAAIVAANHGGSAEIDTPLTTARLRLPSPATNCRRFIYQVVS